MPKFKTNQLTIKALNELQKDGISGRMILDGNNLYIRKNATTTTWYYRVTFFGNTGLKRSWLAIGNYPQMTLQAAREEAEKIRELVNKGINPITLLSNNTDRVGKTFAYVLNEYQAGYFKTIKSNTKKNFINAMRYALPLHGINMEAISEFDILDIVSQIRKAGTDSVANSFLQYVKRLFSYARNEGYILDNKIRDLKCNYSPKQRSRYLQPKELKQLLSSLLPDSSIPLDIRIGIYSLLILMLRRSELVDIKWCNIDLKSGRVMVERTKTIENFTLIIPMQLRQLWLLLNSRENNKLFSFSDHTLYRYIVEVAAKYQIKRFTPHDLRRTAMSLLAEQGYDYLVIDSALAHTIKGVNKSYLKSNLLHKRAELQQSWANYIDKLLGKTVVEMVKNSEVKPAN